MRETLRGKSLIGIALLVLSVALVAAACGGDDDELAAPAPAAPAAAAAPAAEAAALAGIADEPEQPGAAAPAVAAPAAAAPAIVQVMEPRGTYRDVHNHAWAGAESLDPASPARFRDPVQWVQDRLLRLDFDGIPTPVLATAWDVDATAQRWTFNIREGVTFSDGTPMTAQDVVYSIQHHLDPDVGSQLASVLDLIDPDGFEMPDDHTVVINLLSAHVDLPLLLVHYALRVIPADSGDTVWQTGMGTGPFTLETLDPAGISVFTSRDDYWQGLPGAEKFTEVGISDSAAQASALLAGQVDMIRDLTAARALLFEGNDDFIIQENPAGRFHDIATIVTEPPFDDVRIRQALRRVIDVEEMIAVVVQGHGVPACNNPVRPIDQYYLPTDCPQDIEGARALLAEAGYEDGLTVELASSTLKAPWIPMATVYKEQAAEAGINIEINLVPSDGYWGSVWMVHPFAFSNWAMRYADSILNEMLGCGSNWGETFWCNAEFDSLLEQARAETVFETRRDLYQRAQEIHLEDGGLIGPFFMNSIRAMSASVQGLPTEAIEFEFQWHEMRIVEP